MKLLSVDDVGIHIQVKLGYFYISKCENHDINTIRTSTI